MADDNTEKLIIDGSQAAKTMEDVIVLVQRLRGEIVSLSKYSSTSNPFESYRKDLDSLRQAVAELRTLTSAQKLLTQQTVERNNLELQGITRVAKETAEKNNLEQAGIARLAKEIAEKNNLDQAGIVRVAKEIAEKNNLEQAGIARIAKETAEKNNLEQAGIARLAKERADYNNLYLAGLARTAAMEREQAAQRSRPLNLLASRAGRIGDYALIGGGISAIYGTSSEVLALNKALANLQAITQTSTTGMEALRAKIVAVAEGSRFMSSEVADAATTLGQAGLSASQIGDALKGVVALAQATGSDLKASVDIVTTAYGAFGLRADETMNIANTFTAAINKSKLTMEQLSQGFQYSANYAAQAGVSFEELTTVLAAMANAGIRSGSTLGTGLRSLFKDLEKPSKDFRTALSVIHLSLKDIDVQKLGIIQVIKNLHDAGFGASEAMKTLQTRSAAAFVALAGQLDNIDGLRRGIIGTNAALEAATTQMGSFTNTAKQFGSTFTAIVASAFNPFLRGLQAILSNTASVMAVLGEFKGTLAVISTLISGLVVGSITKYVISLVATATGIKAAITAMASATTAAAGLRAAIAAMGGWITVAATALIFLVSWLGKGSDKLDELSNAVDEQKGKADNLKDTYNQVSQETQKLIDRGGQLEKNTNLLQEEADRLGGRFRSLGLDVQNLNGDYKMLIAKMQQVRVLAAQLSAASFTELAQKLDAKAAEQQRHLNKEASSLPFQGLFGSLVGIDRFSSGSSVSSNLLGTGVPPIIAAALERLRLTNITVPNNFGGNSITGQELVHGQLTDRDIKLINSAVIAATAYKEQHPDKAGNVDKILDVLNKNLGKLVAVATTKSDADQARASAAVQEVYTSKQFQDFTIATQKLIGKLDNAPGIDPLNNAKNITILEQFKKKMAPDVRKELAELEAFGKNDLNKQQAVQPLINQLKAAFSQSDVTIAEQKTGLHKKAADAAANAVGDQIKLLGEQLTNATTVEDASAIGEQLKAATTKLFKSKIAAGKDTEQGLEAAVDAVQERVDARVKEIADRLNAATRRMAAHDASILGREISELNRQADLLFKGIDDNTPSTQITEAIQKAREIAGMALGKALDQIGKQAIAGDLTPDQEADAAHTAINNYLDKLSEYGDRSKKPTIQFEGANSNFAEAWQDVLKSLQDPRTLQSGVSVWATTFKDTLVNAFKTAKDSFSEFMTSVENGTARVGDAFKTMGRNILNSMLKTINDRVSQQFMQLLGSGIDSIANSIGGGGIGSAFSSIFGNAGSTASQTANTSALAANTAALAANTAALGGASVTSAATGAGSSSSGGFFSWISSLFNGSGGTASAPPGSYTGGRVRGYLGGGEIFGAIRTRDSVLINAQPGEYMLRKSAVDMIGTKALDRLNTLGNTQVSHAAGKFKPNAKQPAAITNVWVVAPDQKPQMGPNDVIAVIDDNIIRRGSTRQLIKSVAAGTA